MIELQSQVRLSILTAALSLYGCEEYRPPSFDVLQWPADRCFVHLQGSEGAPHDLSGSPALAAVIEGTQVFFSDFLRRPERPASCNQGGWLGVCIRPERVDRTFSVERSLATYGDRVGFTDIRFKNGFRFRICYNGWVLPLDGAHWKEGQSFCPKSAREVRSGLPMDCFEDARLLIGISDNGPTQKTYLHP